MKKLLLLIVVGIFLISFVNAAVDIEVDDIFRVNEVINYSKPCFNNGTYCSAVAVCNYTIYYPNKTILINNKQATNYVAYHSYPLFFSEIGLYQVDMVCHDGGLKGSESFYAQVTGTGFNDTFGFYVIVLLITSALLVAGFWLKDPYIVIFGTFGLYFLGIYILMNGIVGIRDLVTTRAIAIIVLTVAGYISINTTLEILKENY